MRFSTRILHVITRGIIPQCLQPIEPLREDGAGGGFKKGGACHKGIDSGGADDAALAAACTDFALRGGVGVVGQCVGGRRGTSPRRNLATRGFALQWAVAAFHSATFPFPYFP